VCILSFECFYFPGSWSVPGRIHHLISQTQLLVISLRRFNDSIMDLRLLFEIST